MELKIEPTEQDVYLPNYPKYVLPPTPSGSSTDTIPSPHTSLHGEQNMHFYSEYYNTPLNKSSNNAEELGDTQLQQNENQNLESSSLQMSPNQLDHPATQQPAAYEYSRPQHLLNEALLPNPWPNQRENISSDQLQSPPTPSSNSTADDQPQNDHNKKRTRIQFSSIQLVELEKAFQESQYLTRTKKLELAEKLQINEHRVKIWYQNRRMREKKVNGEKRRSYKKRFSKNEIIELSEASKTCGLSQIPSVGKKPEEVSSKLSTSVTNRLLTHSVWAKGQNQHLPSALNSCGQYLPNLYNDVQYSPTLQNARYSEPNYYYYNQYNGQQNYNGMYYISHPAYQYDYNQPNIRNEESTGSGNCVSSQEDLAINFAIAQEFLSKTMYF